MRNLLAVQASGFSLQGLGQHVLVEREIGHQSLEPIVFVLELPESAQSLRPLWAYFFFQP